MRLSRAKSRRYSGVSTRDPDEQPGAQAATRRSTPLSAATAASKPVLPPLMESPESVPEADDPEGGWRGTAERVQDLLGEQPEQYPKTVTTKVDGSARAICCSNTISSSSERPTPVLSLYRFLFLAAATWIGVGFMIGLSGLMITNEEGEALTWVECLYLMSQILTTTGYGDFVPRSKGGKLFFSLYLLASGLFVSGLMVQFIGNVTESSKRSMDETWGQWFSDDPASDTDTTLQFTPTFLKRYKDALVALVLMIVGIVGWTLFFVVYCDWFYEEDYAFEDPMQRCEDRDWQTAVYFAVVGMLGIGFGDVTPRTVGGQLFCSVAGFVGLGVYLNFLESMAGLAHFQNLSSNVEHLMHAGLGDADLNGDRSLDYGEFLQYMLGRYELVSVDVLKKISRTFDDLDVDHDGVITIDEIELMMEAKRSRMKQARPRASLSAVAAA